MAWGTSPLVGRDGELAELTNALATAKGGRPTLIEVAAEAGFGKTRLIGECLDRLTADVTVVQAFCFENDHRPSSLITRLHAALARSAGKAGTDGGAATGGATNSDADVERLLGAMTEREVVVVVLEDLHWADPASLDAVYALGARFAGRSPGRVECRLALIASYRPFELGEAARSVLDRLGSQFGGARLVRPRPLEPLEINALVLGLGYPRPSGRLLAALVDASAGNPLHVEAVMDRLERTARLRRSDGITDFIGHELPIDLGHSLVAAVEFRLKLLPDEDRQLLGLVALLDPPVSPAAVADVAAMSWPTVFERLESARSEHLVDVDESLIVFQHPLLRTVLTRLLSPGQRVGRSPHRGHPRRRRRRSEPRQRRTPSQPGRPRRPPGDGGRHLRARGPRRLRDERLRHRRPAGRDGAGRGRAQRQPVVDRGARPAPPPGRRGPLPQPRPGRVASPLRPGPGDGRADRRSRTVVRRRAAGDPGPHDVRTPPRRRRTARRSAAAARSHPTSTNEPLRGRIEEELAEICFGAGRYDDGERHALAALGPAERSSDRGDEAMAHFALGLNTWAVLRLDEARSSFETCERLSALAADRWLTTWGPGRLSLVGRMEGRFDDVLRATADNALRAQALGDWSELALASALRTSVHAARGDAVLAEQEGARGLALEARGDYVWAPTILLPTLAGLRAAVTPSAQPMRSTATPPSDVPPPPVPPARGHRPPRHGCAPLAVRASPPPRRGRRARRSSGSAPTPRPRPRSTNGRRPSGRWRICSRSPSAAC